jgi:hypothetical protein
LIWDDREDEVDRGIWMIRGTRQGQQKETDEGSIETK